MGGARAARDQAARTRGRTAESRRELSGRTRLLDQGELAGLDDRLELGVNAQLAAQTADVRADGRVTDPKLACDLTAGLAFGHQPEHLLLASGQSLQL